MSYEIPYSTDYTEWYGTPQNVTRLSAVLEQVVDEDGNNIGRITASWDVPDNGGTFNVLTSTDGETYTLAVVGLRNNSTVFNVEPNTDYYIKVITVLDSLQSEGTVSNLLSIDIPTPSAPVLTVLQGGISINVGIIPADYTAVINIDDGTSVTTVTVNEPVYTYMCVAGTYTVTVAYEDSVGNIGDESDPAEATVSELATKAYVEDYVNNYVEDNVYVYNLKTPLVSGYRLVSVVSVDYYADTKDMVILQVGDRQYKKSNDNPAICGYYNGNGWIVPILMSTDPDAVKMYRDNHYDEESYDSVYYDNVRGVNWYCNAYSSSLRGWENIGSITVNPPLIGNGEQINRSTACQLLLEDAQPIVEVVDTESIEENLFYPTDVTLSSGDTITDETLKSLIAFHRPININGTVFTPSGFANNVYTYYALQNGTESTEIKKAQINSSWVITITTESTGGGDVLPIASSSTLGGIKVGNNLSIDENGVLSASGGGSGGGDVTTNTDQNITGTKTFVGQKKILLKQATSTDKLGFTLYTNSGTEKGYFEYNPQNTVDSVPLMTIGNYATASAGLTHVGFRKYSGVSGASGSYNLLAPLIADARSPFNLNTSSYTNFYFPLGVTDGTTMVKTDKRGVLDISSLLSATIPIASSSTLGGIKVGTNLSIDGNGVLSATDTTYTDFVGSGATASSGLVPAPPTTAGTTKYLREDGSWSVPSGGGGGGGSYTAGDGIDISNDVISLDVASANDLGGIKVGSGLSIDGNGVLSATGGGGYTETVLYDNSSGISSGTIPLLDDWNNYHFISFVVWNGGTGAKNQQFFSSGFLEDCYTNVKDFIVIRYTTSQVTLTPKTDYKTLSIKNNGDNCKVYKVVGHKFG